MTFWCFVIGLPTMVTLDAWRRFLTSYFMHRNLDFNMYTGKDMNGKSDHGLAYDVVMKLVAPFLFQGYHLYIDNFHTSQKLLYGLYQCEMYTTGTFPSDGKLMKEVLNG